MNITNRSSQSLGKNHKLRVLLQSNGEASAEENSDHETVPSRLFLVIMTFLAKI